MAEITFVKQKHKRGCGIASMAMVSGKDYDDIVKEFLNDFDEEGMTTQMVLDYLGNLGYAIVFKQLSHYNEKDFARQEMLRPFAPAHILSIKWKADATWHFVVMTEDGKLICPDGKTDAEIRDSYVIEECMGLYK